MGKTKLDLLLEISTDVLAVEKMTRSDMSSFIYADLSRLKVDELGHVFYENKYVANSFTAAGKCWIKSIGDAYRKFRELFIKQLKNLDAHYTSYLREGWIDAICSPKIFVEEKYIQAYIDDEVDMYNRPVKLSDSRYSDNLNAAKRTEIRKTLSTIKTFGMRCVALNDIAKYVTESIARLNSVCYQCEAYGLNSGCMKRNPIAMEAAIDTIASCLITTWVEGDKMLTSIGTYKALCFPVDIRTERKTLRIALNYYYERRKEGMDVTKRSPFLVISFNDLVGTAISDKDFSEPFTDQAHSAKDIKLPRIDDDLGLGFEDQMNYFVEKYVDPIRYEEDPYYSL